MCTVTLFRLQQGYRIFMNRDERHDRVAEQAPQILHQAPKIVGPVDPQSQGSWILFNDTGHWGCLLNGYQSGDKVQQPLKSRGQLLLTCLQQPQPIQWAESLDPQAFSSFHLILGTADNHHIFSWNGQTYQAGCFQATYENKIFFMSSSSWQTDRVLLKRKQVFEQWCLEHENPDAEMPEYHYKSHLPADTAILMWRAYAKTQSITRLDIQHKTQQLYYYRLTGTDLNHFERQPILKKYSI